MVELIFNLTQRNTTDLFDLVPSDVLTRAIIDLISENELTMRERERHQTDIEEEYYTMSLG